MGVVVVYSVTGCRHCTAAKHALSQAGVLYTDIDVDTAPAAVRTWLAARVSASQQGALTLPQVFVNYRLIGGNSQLQDIISDDDEWRKLLEYLDDVQVDFDNKDAPMIPRATTPQDVRSGLDLEESNTETRLAVALMMRPSEVTDRSLTCSTGSRGHGRISRVLSGHQVMRGISTVLGSEHEEVEVVKWAQKLLDAGFMLPLKRSGNSTFQPSTEFHYKLFAGEYGQPLNVFSAHDTDAAKLKAANIVSASNLATLLRRKMSSLYQMGLSADGKLVDYRQIGSSSEWLDYVALTRSLLRVDIFSLSEDERAAFFINVYNALVIHGNIVYGNPNSLWQKYKFFNIVSYSIAGRHSGVTCAMTFSLQDIENGVLRANRRAPTALFRQFSSVGDLRLSAALRCVEPRVHFALNCGAHSCPPVKTFSPQNIDAELSLATASYLSTDEGLCVTSDSVVMISSLFKWYRADFGNTDRQVLEWVLSHMADGERKRHLVACLDNTQCRIKYIAYNWRANSVS